MSEPSRGRKDGLSSETAANQKSGWSNIWDWVKAILVAVVIAFLIHHFLFAQFQVDGLSMYPTLRNNERLLVDKIPYYFGPPKPGDIIVFKSPFGEDWVKRVIGIPGETLRIYDGQLYIDGKLIKEPFINGPMNPYKNFGPVTVPPGHLFVMGDNRNISEDSRVIGPIPISSVIGRVDFVFWPLDHFKFIGPTQEHYLPQSP
ncbi:signal peptidase I [Sulfoacidibacillus thermotolerans]|uniref:Signal peptidase I n=1 Tax=Sulfoacidibacillus thermotolerans TaxID=1765684 RepID=A0A2U3DBG1_SULT2|nr:signal peptidase I [Sulfoacidibacillus thermotolerans]PWI58616.1 signal peptidase I [Sulfoacidibacillus thermotolerans]